MRRAVLIAVVATSSLAALTACGPSGSSAPASSAPQAAPTSPPPVAAPPAPQPATVADCPYLDKTFVQDANGQHVGSVKISAPDGQPHPSCFFYRPDGGLQVTVRVYAGDPKVAQAIVNQAAPVSSSDPASDPAGWQGGLESTGNGAVYAVAKGGDGVVVTTNQAQTIKARRIAVQAIAGLGM